MCKKKNKKDKVKKTNIFKAINYNLINIDVTRTFARMRYTNWFIITCCIDLITLVLIAFDYLGFLWLVIPLGLFTLHIVRMFLQNLYYKVRNSIYKNQLKNGPRAQCASGTPGSGKTSSKVYECVELANDMWKDLKTAYFLCLRLNKDKLKPKQVDTYNEIVGSYQFFISHPNNIPCLFSNVPIWIGKRRSYKLTKKHLLQQTRLPYFSVLFNDEIGCQFKAKKGNQDNLDPLSELARFIRHFIDGYWNFTEQEFSKAFIDIRRVTGSNKWYIKQTWRLRPVLLIKIYDLILWTVMFDFNMSHLFKSTSSQYARLIKSSKRQSKVFGGFLKWLKRYISNCGWREYVYQELGNCESDAGQDKKDRNGKTRKIYLPACLNANYESRAYKNKYKCKDKETEYSVFESNILSTKDLKDIFGND